MIVVSMRRDGDVRFIVIAHGAKRVEIPVNPDQTEAELTLDLKFSIYGFAEFEATMGEETNGER